MELNPMADTKNRNRGGPSAIGRWRRCLRLPLFIVAIAALCAFLPHFVLAQAPPAHVFFGTVTVNRLPLKDGTVLTAFVDGRQTAAVKIVGGKYEIAVERPADRPLAGKPVRFKIGNLETDAATRWTAGQTTRLDIKVIHAFQPPVRIPRRQVASVPKVDQEKDAIQDIQRQIAELKEDRAITEFEWEKQLNAKMDALARAIDVRAEELQVAAEEELDSVVRKVEDAINRPRLNPLNPQQIRRLESEVESTETDLRQEFDQEIELLERERANRESELLGLANAELDDLERRIKEKELELERRIIQQELGRAELDRQAELDRGGGSHSTKGRQATVRRHFQRQRE